MSKCPNVQISKLRGGEGVLGLFPQYEDFYKLFRKRPGKVWEICANFNYCNDKLFFKKHFPSSLEKWRKISNLFFQINLKTQMLRNISETNKKVLINANLYKT